MSVSNPVYLHGTSQLDHHGQTQTPAQIDLDGQIERIIVSPLRQSRGRPG
jgi:hypothetical protein